MVALAIALFYAPLCAFEGVVAAQNATKRHKHAHRHRKKCARRVHRRIKHIKRKRHKIGSTRGEKPEIGEKIFSWPLARNSFWLSSLFGPRNLGDGRGTMFHSGVDLAAVTGTPVRAAADGEVMEAYFNSKGYGKTVLLDHHNGYKTRYAHLHRIKVQIGQMISQGHLLGTVGATGNVRSNGTSAAHLHFEVQKNGKAVNPLSYLP